MKKKSVLYIVSTPIGNLSDISLRAIEILQKVNYILLENLEHGRILIKKFCIKTSIISIHEYNEELKIQWILNKLNIGNSLALISDAGTPLVNDPGYKIVQKVKKNGYKISPIPGPCALIAALSVSGLPTHHFEFIGFMPRKYGEKLLKIQSILEIDHTIIFYESKHRIINTLNMMSKFFEKERLIVLAKELTKKFEKIITGNIDSILEWIKCDIKNQKGEFVLLVEPCRSYKRKEITTDINILISLLHKKLKASDLAKFLSKLTQEKRKKIYKKIILNNI